MMKNIIVTTIIGLHGMQIKIIFIVLVWIFELNRNYISYKKVIEIQIYNRYHDILLGRLNTTLVDIKLVSSFLCSNALHMLVLK